MLEHSRACEGASSADTIRDNFKAYGIEDEGGKSGGRMTQARLDELKEGKLTVRILYSNLASSSATVAEI